MIGYLDDDTLGRVTFELTQRRAWWEALVVASGETVRREFTSLDEWGRELQAALDELRARLR